MLVVLEVPHGTPFDKAVPQRRQLGRDTRRAGRTAVSRRPCRLALLTDGELLRWSGPVRTGRRDRRPGRRVPRRGARPPGGFVELLGARRFFAVPAEKRLDALLPESADGQQEVTRPLGGQVRQAVELLVNAISRPTGPRANRSSRRRAARGLRGGGDGDDAARVPPRSRGAAPAAARRPASTTRTTRSSTLREQLEERADRTARSRSRRPRRLGTACSRPSGPCYGGIEHERAAAPAVRRLPVRPRPLPVPRRPHAGDRLARDDSSPLPVDDRTMLHLLDALQQLEGQGRAPLAQLPPALDVEQIGHVYEGLLDHGCVRADEVVVGLDGKEGDEPELPLSRLEGALGRGQDALVELVAEGVGADAATRCRRSSSSSLGRRTSARCRRPAGTTTSSRAGASLPPAPAARPRGLPMVFPPGSLYVTQTAERRDSGHGLHDAQLADEVVQYALEPLVYAPGPAQSADRSEWRLKTSRRDPRPQGLRPRHGLGRVPRRGRAATSPSGWSRHGAPRSTTPRPCGSSTACPRTTGS